MIRATAGRSSGRPVTVRLFWMTALASLVLALPLVGCQSGSDEGDLSSEPSSGQGVQIDEDRPGVEGQVLGVGDAGEIGGVNLVLERAGRVGSGDETAGQASTLVVVRIRVYQSQESSHTPAMNTIRLHDPEGRTFIPVSFDQRPVASESEAQTAPPAPGGSRRPETAFVAEMVFEVPESAKGLSLSYRPETGAASGLVWEVGDVADLDALGD